MSKTTGWPRRGAAVLVAAAMLLTPLATGSARAQPPASPPSAQPAEPPAPAAGAIDRARQHYARGKELFAAGEYRQAIGEFAAADKLAPSPLLEFNIALCHERLLERGEAIRRYRLYLSRVPDAKNRADVEQRIARLEEAMKAEAETRSPPPAAGAIVPVPGAPPVSPGATPTGDPDLDRVARIDVARLRAERRAGSPAEPAPPRAAAPAPSPAPASSPDRGEPKKDRPIYKRWWFWVVAGVSAIVIINIATSDSDSSDGRALLLPMGDGRRAAPDQGGAVLLRF